MILERVELTNYRSHRDTQLALPLACVISGPVGSGKSSLQESFRLAAFGETDSKDPRGHIGLGADRCRVLWQFRTLDGQRYRILLNQSVSGDRVRSDLQLTVSKNGNWTPITGKSIADTRAKIIEILGCDYDTITSSAICPQGLSSKFTQPPKVYIDGRYYEGRAARLMIFAQAEGLGVWEERRKAAVKEAGVVETQAVILERQAASGAMAIGELNAARGGRLVAEAGAETSALSIRETEGILAGVRQDIQTLTARIAETTATADAYRTEVAALVDDEGHLLAKQTKADRYREILAHRTEIEARALESDGLKQQLTSAREAWIVLDERLAEVQRRRDEMAASQIHVQETRGQILGEEQRIQAEAKGLLPLIHGHTGRAAVMGTVPCIGVQDLPDRCPLLAEARRSRLELKDLQARQAKLSAWVRPSLPEAEPMMGVDAELQDLRQAKLREQERQKNLERSVDALSRWASVLPELAIAEVEMATLVPEIARLEERIAGLRERAGLALKMAEAVRADQASLRTLQAEENGHVLDLVSLRQAERTAAQDLANADAEIRRLEAAVAEAEKATEEAKELRTRHAKLTVLALAYKQIPIMILETQAVPQVELEANRILAKISRNGMRTELRTLREVKSRDELADGLDIIITDRRGQRTYEDFSGGQKFQVDLAYRVALSRRQSHRSGGGIGCLWVDEGWGTQDSGSLETLVQALRDLSGEIPQLLVTSHVEALKETFPIRVEVSGGPEASVVRVVGR